MMRPESRLVHRDGASLSPPLDRSTTFRHVGELEYQRSGHPVGLETEELLGALDGGQALLFASGLAAVTAVALALLEPGDRVAIPGDGYFGTERLFETELSRWGLSHVDFDQTGPVPRGVRMAFLETPANPSLSFPDIVPFVEAAHAQGTLVAVDATVATPMLLRPLEHGADIVVHSATKGLAGHSDTLVGAVVCRDAALTERLRSFRTLTGAVAGPDAAWLLLRGLQTLAVRVARSSETALEIANRLAAHPRVTKVRYPGLGPDPVAARYMHGGFGPLLSFDVAGDAESAQRVEAATSLIANATSLGGVHSTMETRHRYEGERVPPGLIRLSIGLEHVDDLWDDLCQALERA
jgi:cystathionine gamma-synthase